MDSVTEELATGAEVTEELAVAFGPEAGSDWPEPGFAVETVLRFFEATEIVE